MVKKVIDWLGFRVLGAWIAEFIKSIWEQTKADFLKWLYAQVSMMYLFHETNVQAISQYGIEGKTYVFGDSSTENGAIPANALYYMDNGVQQFVTTEEGEYIPTEPNDQGEMFTAEYHDYITYLA